MAIEPRRPGARDLSITNEPIVESPRPKPAVTLSAGDVEAIAEATARKLAELVADRGKTFGLVGPRELAEGLGVSLDYVYAHATELGAMRLGSGPKARMRFDSTAPAERSRHGRNGRRVAAGGRRCPAEPRRRSMRRLNVDPSRRTLRNVRGRRRLARGAVPR